MSEEIAYKERLMPRFAAAIFDFDGLLVNTEELREQSLVNFLKKYGKTFEFPDYAGTMLASTEETTKFLKGKYELPGEIDNLTKERRSFFDMLFQSRLALMEGVVEVLERARGIGLRMAIASNRYKADVLDALRRLGVDNYFEVIVNIDDVENKKPHPEIYLLASEKLGIEPRQCLVLEDAPHGVESGKAAGMTVVYVPSIRYFDEKHDKADLILKTMHELTDEVFKKLELI